MNDYTGKICPYCKTAFKPDDEIVVCSECDMPHHKDCWIENQGCTTFGCLGTIKTADNDNSSVTTREMSFEDISPSAGATVYCTKCGAQMKVHLCSVQNAVTDCQHRCLLKHRPFSNQILQTQIRMHM